MTDRDNQLTHDELCDIAEKWLQGKNCGFVFKELDSLAGEIPDAIGFKSCETILIECKASRADFLSDKTKRVRVSTWQGMGKYRFYMCPDGMIKIDELPDGWGLIYVKENRKARMAFGPKGNYWENQSEFKHERSKDAEMSMMYSALRRLNLRKRIPEIYEPL